MLGSSASSKHTKVENTALNIDVTDVAPTLGRNIVWNDMF